MNRFRFLIYTLCLAALFTACGGGSSTSSEEQVGDAQTISSNNSGSITLSVSTSLATTATAAFTVTLLDAQGAAIVGADITCQSEQGIAILSPVTGGVATGVLRELEEC